MHPVEPVALGPSRSNRWSSNPLLLGAALTALAVTAPALAQEPPSALPEPPSEPTAVASSDAPTEPFAGELRESEWDLPGQLVIDARDDLSDGELAGFAASFGLRLSPTDLAAETRIELAEVPAGEEPAWMERLRADERVEGVEPLAKVRAFFAPNDPLLKDQWHLTRIGAERAWDFATGRGVVVAVVDTGIACEDHGPFSKGSDLAATRCVAGWSFVSNDAHASDDQGHGTHVAGTIAQSTNNGLGAAGVAFDASLMPVKVLNERGWGTTADVADGIRWAADHGAHVINLSLGGPRNSQILQKAIDHAVGRGVVVVAAAGNTGGRVQFPGASDGVIGVSATDPNDKLASFSSRGDGVDVAAPGVSVLQQTICNRGRDKCERFQSYNGTSMAAPHVAGAAAELVSLGVTDPVAVEEVLRETARVVDDSDAGRARFGAGILDIGAAARRVTMWHAGLRLGLLVAFAAWASAAARRKNAASPSTLSPLFLIFALFAGPGLFFFAPWILPRATFWVDLAARPLPDLDLYIGASVHRFLPLANVFLPLGLTVIGFGWKSMRVATAGLAVGLASYLGALVLLRDAAGPFGTIALVFWAILNIVGCLWIARVNLEASN